MVLILFLLCSILHAQIIPSRLHVIDHDNRRRCFITRGSLPLAGNGFAHTHLISSLQSLTNTYNFKLVIISFLNHFTARQTRNRYIEQKFMDQHPQIVYISNPILGSFIKPAKALLFLRSIYDFDNSDHLVDSLHQYVTNCNERTVVYVHCSAGLDRTGFITAAYRMKWEGMQYKQAYKQSNGLIKSEMNRSMHFNSHYALKWYCLALGREQRECGIRQ